MPIIALTASAFDEEKEAIIASHCNNFVTKPFQKKAKAFFCPQKVQGFRSRELKKLGF